MSIVIAQGRRGEITLDTINGIQIATKRARNSFAKWAILKEQDILRFLNEQKVVFVPQLHERGDDWFSYIWIEGIHFRDAYKQSGEAERVVLARALLERAYQLDSIGVVHGELSLPHSNVLVNRSLEQPVFLIDFERWTLRDFSGKNMKGLAQRLRSEWYITMEECKEIWNETVSLSDKYNLLMSKINDSKAVPTVPFWKVLLGIIVLVAIDMLMKYLFYNLKRGEESRLLTPVLNTWIGRSIAVPLPIVGMLTAVIIWVIFYLRHRKHVATLPTLFFVAGALGNGLDRLIYHGVRDFIDLHIWPVFNGADIYLTIAILLLLYIAFSSPHGSTT